MQYKFTKDDTWAIKGISILFLVCLHCISRERVQGMQISFWPLSAGTANWWIGLTAQCVGMFEFLSIYGMTLSEKKQYPELDFTKRQAAAGVVKRYLGLVLKFLIPFIVCFGVTYGMGIHRYRNGFWKNILSMLTDILCIGNLFGNSMMVPTWWYMSLEVVLIVFLPLILRFYKKYSWLTVGMTAVIGTMYSQRLTAELMTKFLFVVPLAVCFADQEVFERLKSVTLINNKILNKIIKSGIAFGMICIMCRLRELFPSDKANFQFILLGLIPTVLIYFFYELLIDLPMLRGILIFFGKHSANIFYIHSFVRGLWLKDVAYSFHSAWMIVAFVFAATLIISILIEFISKKTGYRRITDKCIKKTVKYLMEI